MRTNGKREPVVVIMKPLSMCNLSCVYCDVWENFAIQKKMSDAILERSISEVLLYNGKDNTTMFLWHGGEPLLMGLDFFKRIVEFQKSFAGYNYINCIQSNITLLDEDYITFFKENGFESIGTSIDGPREIHNLTRKNFAKRGSFDSVMKAVQLASKHKMAIGAVVVLNRGNVDKVKEIYHFFKSNNMHFNVLPVVIYGRGQANEDLFSITPEEYGQAMVELFDLWFYDENPVTVTTLVDIVRGIIKDRPFMCKFSKNCAGSYISIDYYGDVYLCNCVAGDENFKYGNIMKKSLEEILQSEVRKALSKRDASQIEDCKNCEFLRYCNGGCIYHAYTGFGNAFEKDYFCPAYKMLFRHILEKLNHEVNTAEQIDYII